MSAIDFEAESDRRMSAFEATGGPAHGGITVLDWFAGRALQGTLAGRYRGSVEDFVKDAYDLAEAMLKERNKRFTPQGAIKGVTGKTYG